jgi:hypothetical protein
LEHLPWEVLWQERRQTCPAHRCRISKLPLLLREVESLLRQAEPLFQQQE